MIWSMMKIFIVACMAALVAVKADTGTNTCVRACIIGSDGRPTSCTDWLDRITSATTTDQNLGTSSATESVFNNASTTSNTSVFSNVPPSAMTTVNIDTPTFSTTNEDSNNARTITSTRVITNTVTSITNRAVSAAPTSFSSAVSNAETSATSGLTTGNPTSTTISLTTSVVRSSLSSTARSSTTVSTNLQDYNFLYGIEYGDSTITNVDDFCEKVPNSYHNLYVCSNGLISLNGSYVYYTPSALTGANGLSLVAPYHSDIDLRYGGGFLYYHLYDAKLQGSISNQSNVRTAEALVKQLTRRKNFTALYLLIATWDKVLHYPANSQDSSRRVSFQLVLVSDGVNTYAVYKYFPGQMRFVGNYDVFIGYLLPPDIYVQHSLSFTTEALSIDQNVQTQGRQGILFYQLTGERIDTTNEEAFNFGAEIGDQMFGDADDRCVNVQNTYTFPLFSTLHRDIYVCSNGIVTIDRSHISPDLPTDLNSVEFDILMPYYTDIELKNNGVVYYQVTDVTKDDQFKERENVIKAESYVRGLKTSIRYFEAQFLLVVTWHRVTPYPADIRSNETMSFQLVLVSDGYETYVLYIYFENEMNLQENNALIGYMTRPGRFVQHLYSSTPLARNISSLLRTRDRRGAIFYELTEFPNEDNVYRHKCIKWYARNNAGRVIFNRSMSEMPDCPCNLDFLRRDRRFTGLQFSQGDAQCSYMRPSWWFRPLGVGKTCCYHEYSDQYFVDTGPYAGGFVRYNPWFYNAWHVRDDLQMREYCCDKTDLCHLYRALRPIGNCYTTFPVSFANFWGDPHIETLDGRKYTFNGHGEYTLLTLSSGSTTFVLQARTSRAEKSNGNFSDATVFSAFAAKDDRGVQAHVELNSTKTGLLIFAKTGSSETFDDYTLSFASEATLFAVDTENGSFFRENNRTAFTAVFSSGIFLTITQRHKMLSISVGIPSRFRGQTRGLLGNFDGNITNDFICGNGTQLDNTITDREIFQFGQSWTINGPDSVFRYPNGKHSADYSHQDFTPKFIDEADPAMVANATRVCGEENQECIFDLVFTENEELANDTLHIAREAEEARRQIANVVPHIEGPSIVEATMNATVTYTISGMDDDMIGYRFLTNDIGATLQLNESCGAFVSFTMSVDIPIELRVIAEDNNGVISNLCEPTIIFCSGCNNHGVCDFTTYKDDNRTTATFKYARCICNEYWSGSDCVEDFDSCADSPCSALRTCTDYPPALHEQLRIGYNCSDCPGGYNIGGDGKCIDIDECSTMNGGCEQICRNLQGSYQCSCFSAFRIQSNGKTCKDIDECEESLSDCDQICLNTNGSYNCSCFQGFEYNVISRTCLAGQPPSVCSDLNCSNSTGCTIDANGNATCFCKIGYHLSSDGSSCEDADECIQNTCQQICTNTPGSFQCTCYAGFQMDIDKLTCKPCEPLMFGVNCSQVCECGHGAERCDPVRGCICRAGWRGSTCESDVDECRDPNICRDVLKSCVNTNGSYACTCIDGYILKESNVCSDVDECNDPDLDVCEQECVNTAGGFYCTCEAGFIIDPHNNTRCKDINECTNGQSGCQHICENTPGRFTCDCYYGYRLTSDRKSCEQVENPCATMGNFNCSQICVVTDNSSFCSCNQGYHLLEDRQSCIDINECSAESLNQCSHKYRCLNNEGGYTCSCDIGFRLDKDGRTCQDCDDFHYGPDCSIPCNCGVGALICDPATGCVCKNGWRGEKCTVDINECNSIRSPCIGANTVCINTNGSYICACVPGFRNTSNGCEDINECEDPLLNDCEQICVNKESNYTCDCYPGFLQDQHKCYDINECAGQNNCSHSCENTHGGYRCTCDEGFKLNLADKRTCIPKTLCQLEAELACRIKGALCVEKQDVAECYCAKGYAFSSNETYLNECENNTCQEICTNIPGGYICSCNTGKMIARDGKTCTDCRDGKYGDGCGNSCFCNNSNTEKCSKLTGECACRPGWQGSACDTDLDECLSNSTCPKDSVCINTMGSHICTCQAGFMMTTSEDCMECDSRHFGDDCTQECTCLIENTESCDKVAGICTCINNWAGQSCELKITTSTTMTATPQEHSTNSSFETLPTNESYTTTSTTYSTPEPSARTSFPTAIIPTDTPITIMTTETISNTLNATIRTTQEIVTTSSTLQTTFTSESSITEPNTTISTTTTTTIPEWNSNISTSTSATTPEATIISSSTTNTRIPDPTTTSSTIMTTIIPESTTTLSSTAISTTPEQAPMPSTTSTTTTSTPTTFSLTTKTTTTVETSDTSSAATTISAIPEPTVTSSTSATTTTHDTATIIYTTTNATTPELTTTSSTTETATIPVPMNTTLNTDTTAMSEPSTTTTPEPTTTSSTAMATTIFEPTTPSTAATILIPKTTTKSATDETTERAEPTTTMSTTTTTAISEPTSISMSTNTTPPKATIISSPTTNTRKPELTTTSSIAMTTTIRESTTTSSTTTISTTPEQSTMLSTTTTVSATEPTKFSSTITTTTTLQAADTSAATTPVPATPDPAIKSSTPVTTTTPVAGTIALTTATSTTPELATTISSTTSTTTTLEPTTTLSTTMTMISPEESNATLTTATTGTSKPSTTSSTTASIPASKPASILSTMAPTATPEPTTISSTTASATITVQSTTAISTRKITTILQSASNLLSTSTTMTTSEPTTIPLTTLTILKPETNSTLSTTTTVITPEVSAALSTTATTTTTELNTTSSTSASITTSRPTLTSSTTAPTGTPEPNTISSTTASTTGQPSTTISTATTVTPVSSSSLSTTLVTTTTPTFMPTSTLSTSATKSKPESTTTSSITTTRATTRLVSLSSTTTTTTTLTPTSSSSTTKTRTTQESIFSSSTVKATTLEPTASSVTGGNNIMTSTTTPEITTSVAANGTTTTTPTMKKTTLTTGLTTTLESTKPAPVTKVKTTKIPIYSTSTVSNKTIGACQEDSFGSNCEKECKCKRENAANPNQTCSPTNGTCICKSGWTGNCDEDIDECAVETNICNDRPNTGCHNIDGGYRCSCLIGFEENKNGVCVDAIGKETTTLPSIKEKQLGIRCSITFNIQISVSLNLNVRETYNHYEYAVRVTLKIFFASFRMQNSVQVVVTSVRRGSLIVDYVLILENSEETKQQLTKAFEQLATGEPVTIDGKNATAKNLSFGNVSITNGTLGSCFIYQAMYGRCPDSHECLVENGIPTCRLKETLVSDSTALIIGLCTGIPVCILSIVLVVLAVCLQKRKREKSKHLEKSEDKTYRFDLHRMTYRFKGRHRREEYFSYGQWPNYNGSLRSGNEC